SRPAWWPQRGWWPQPAWWVEISRFAIVGGVAFVVDMGLFNLLVFGPGQMLGHKPVTAKIIAALVATFVSWMGNRHWTFSERRSRRRSNELATYATINVVALLIAPSVLYVTTYWVGATGPLAANVASVTGIGVGTIVRYTGYKLWVFPLGRVSPPARRDAPGTHARGVKRHALAPTTLGARGDDRTVG
ncbi:MAG: GtrA family protein, partial [Micrococcales bacterium]|nr:GtrA family protein [Micrococcales bacterium]